MLSAEARRVTRLAFAEELTKTALIGEVSGALMGAKHLLGRVGRGSAARAASVASRDVAPSVASRLKATATQGYTAVQNMGYGARAPTPLGRAKQFAGRAVSELTSPGQSYGLGFI